MQLEEWDLFSLEAFCFMCDMIRSFLEEDKAGSGILDTFR